ncbi:MAG: adenylate/guanylate cyclase domain-containing protein [Cyanobacteria bacterium P01_C01_bin.120]
MTHTTAASGPGLLLVDASGEQSPTLMPALLDGGLTVFTVGSITAAWACITALRPQLVLLVIPSGSATGYEFCRQLQQMPQTAHISVLFIGEAGERGDRLRAFEAGGVDFIPMPYWPEEVVARLRLHLRSDQTQSRVKPRSGYFAAPHRYSPLLASLQKTLHQQALKLKEQNIQLQREIHERHEVEQELRHEKHKSEQLLLNILPEAIVTQLKQFQGSLAERFDEATVLFADIVNFTPLAAQYSPLELVNLLNQIFSEFDRLAEIYGLEKIKTIGDAYMAVGGVPVPQANHAIAVADMALAMQATIQTFNRNQNMPLQLRIGINTGSVVAGVIGIKKFSYDLWGDTVNVASRMESHGQPSKIQVTEATYHRLHQQFQFAPAQDIEIKGKGSMRTYYLTGRL